MLIGIAVMRDPWPARLATALCWPLGPIAFILVVSVMLVVATILWPAVLVPVWAIIAAIVWFVA